MKVSQLKAGSILSYFQMALNVLIQLIYTPIMINSLGQSEYGLYQTVASAISMLSVLSLGFNAGYVRYFARYKAERNQEAIYKLNGLYLIIFSIIGVIGFCCGLFLTFHLELLFASGLTQEEYVIARILMFLQTINLAIMFPMSVFQTIITANEKFVVLKTLSMLKTICGPLVSIPLLLKGYGSIVLVAVTVAISLITDILHLYYVIFRQKEKFIFHDFDPGLFKSLFIYTSFIAINSIVDQINLNIDKVLLSRYVGTSATAVYSVGFTIYQLYQTFSSSISSVFTPRIHGIVNRDMDSPLKLREELTSLFTRVGRIQFLVLSLVATGIIFFGKTFILQYWAGPGYEDSYYVALLLVLPASIALIQNLGIEIQRAENRHQFRSIAYLIMALVNLILSIYLCQLYGPIGSAFGTAISLIFVNGIAMNIYYHKRCEIDIIYFWKSILLMGRGLVIPICFGIVIVNVFDLNNILHFFAGIFCYIIVYALSIWMLSMNDYDKNLLIGPLNKLITRHKS